MFLLYVLSLPCHCCKMLQAQNRQSCNRKTCNMKWKKNGTQNPPPNLQLKTNPGFLRLPTAQQRAAVEPPPTQPKWMLGWGSCNDVRHALPHKDFPGFLHIVHPSFSTYQTLWKGRAFLESAFSAMTWKSEPWGFVRGPLFRKTKKQRGLAKAVCTGCKLVKNTKNTKKNKKIFWQTLPLAPQWATLYGFQIHGPCGNHGATLPEIHERSPHAPSKSFFQDQNRKIQICQVDWNQMHSTSLKRFVALLVTPGRMGVAGWTPFLIWNIR